MAKLNKGHILLSRKITDWRYWKDAEMVKLWIWILLHTNFRKTMLDGIIIHRGYVVICKQQIAEELGLSYDKIRTRLEKLCGGKKEAIPTEIPTKFPTKNCELDLILKSSKYSIYRVNNYNEYQKLKADNSNVSQQNSQQNSQQYNKRIFTKDKNTYKKENKKEDVALEGATSKEEGKTPEGVIPDYFKDHFETYEQYIAWRYQ